MSVLVPKHGATTAAMSMTVPALSGSVNNIQVAHPMAQMPMSTAQVPMPTGCAFPQPLLGANNPSVMYAPGAVRCGQGAVPSAGFASPPPAGMAAPPVYGGPGALPSAGLAPVPGGAASPMQPQRLTTGMPDPSSIETQKAMYHQSLDDQMGKAEEMLVRQQKEQTDYIYQVAELQKKQMLNQIAQQAKEQELLLSQKYSQQFAELQQQCATQKILLEKQASELSNSYHARRMQEELMEREFQKQRVHYDEAAKKTAERQRSQRNERLQYQPDQWQYNPQLKIPVDIRAEPDIQGTRTEFTLQPGDLFLVSQEREGADGVVYLRLADGRGWVFDRKPDNTIMCMRVSDSLMGSSAQPFAASAGVPSAAVPSPMMPPVQSCGNQPSALEGSLRSLPQAPRQSLAGSVPMPCPGVQVQALPAGAPMPRGALSQWIYSPEITALVDVRAVPDIAGQRTAHVMQPGEVFSVSEELEGRDGILYLRLADGRGWVFDHKPEAGRMCVRHPSAPHPAMGLPLAAMAPLSVPGMQAVQFGPYPPAVAQSPALAMSNSFDVVASSQSAWARVNSFDAVASSSRVSSFHAAASSGAGAATSHWMYNPEVFAPIDTRAVPEVEGPRLGHRLKPGDVFGVSEEKEADGVLFLRLADGRGWLFDRKPGFGTMCVRHPAPRQPAAVIASMSGSQALPTGCAMPGTTLQQPVPAGQQMISYISPGGPAFAPMGSQMAAAAGSAAQPAVIQTSTALPIAGAPLQLPAASAQPGIACAAAGAAYPAVVQQPVALPIAGAPLQLPAASAQPGIACATAGAAYPAVAQQHVAVPAAATLLAGTAMQPAVATVQQSAAASCTAYGAAMQTAAVGPAPLRTSALTTGGQSLGGSIVLPPTQYVGPATQTPVAFPTGSVLIPST